MKIYENGSNWVIEDYLNEELVNEISYIIEKNLNNLYKDKEGYSTKGKNAYQYWFTNGKHNIDYKDVEFIKFKEKYKEQIFNRLKKSDILSKNIISDIKMYDNNCWTVIGEENSYHTVHQHCSGNMNGISTVLYLKVPLLETTYPENNIFLLMNSGPNSDFYENKPGVIDINPEVGKLLIFPNWIYHGTYPQSKGIRQTFNLDYFFGIELDTNKTQIINYA